MKIGTQKNLNAPCASCLKESNKKVFGATFIGVQNFISHDLELFNCCICGTTRGGAKIEHASGQAVPRMNRKVETPVVVIDMCGASVDEVMQFVNANGGVQ